MNKSSNKLGFAAWLALTMGFLFMFTPILFTQSWFSELVDLTETGQIGDTIGGITAPFMSLVGGILVFLSFRAQIDMNKKQFEAINIQFERLKTEDERREIDNIQHVIDIFNKEYSKDYKSMFKKNITPCFHSYIGSLSKIDIKTSISFLEESLKLQQKFTLVLHLKELLIRNKDNKQIDFIKVQINMILLNYEVIKMSKLCVGLLGKFISILDEKATTVESEKAKELSHKAIVNFEKIIEIDKLCRISY